MRAFLLLCLFTFTSVFSQIPTDDIKRYLFTNGSLVNEAIPGTSDLIATGSSRAVTLDPLSTLNNAMSLNGDQLNAGNRIPSGGSIGNGEVSISFWFKSNTTDSSPRMIISQYESETSGYYGWNILLQNGKIKLTSKSLINGITITPELVIESLSSLADNNWHHVVCIVNKTTFFYSGNWTHGPQATLYVDNVNQGSNYSGGATSQPLVYINPNNKNIVIADGAPAFSESIDNIRIYNKTLSVAEIQALFYEYTGTVVNLFVDLNATGSNNGSSWTNAYTTLQAALAALPSSSANQIWIAKGTYKPHATNRAASFTISSADAKLYGGFSGNETQLSERIVGANETILSGDLLGNDDSNITYVNSSRDDNSYTVLSVLGDNVELDGLTIAGGNSNGAPGSATEARYGGGIYKNPATRNLTITNCKLIRNFSKEAGGAISAGFSATGSTGTFTMNNCVFSENLSAIGGVLYTANTGTLALTFSVSNSIFSKNKAIDTNAAATGYAGSSMWLRSYGSTASIISNFTNCTFVDNVDSGSASGMTNSNRATLALTKNTNSNHISNISNCVFWGNKAVSGAIARPIGGFIESMISSATIKNSIDETNFTGVTLSGTSANTSNSNPLFTNLSSSDYTLTSSSPAVDTGNNANVIGTTDLFGNQRIINTTVDMGAYEFQGCVAPYNINVNLITDTTANVTWSIGGTSALNVDLVYVLSGQPISSGAPITGISVNSYALTGLTPNTNYDVYLMSNCPSSSSSGWSLAYTFKTLWLGPIYVDHAATGSGDGSSWANAFTTLDEGLLNMTPIKQIRVAQGIYKPSTSGLADPRKATFLIPNNAKIYGGFNGTEATLAERNPKTNITTLNGDLSGNDNSSIFHTTGSRSDNTYHVVTLKGSLAGIVMDGFTISGGNANGSYNYTLGVNSFDDTRGGAIYANTNDAANYSIYAEVTNCILEKNTGSDVGVYAQVTTLLNSYISINFNSCIVRNNQSSGSFSNIFLQGFKNSTTNQVVSSYFTNCLFHNNVSNGSASQGASCILTYQNATAGGAYTTAYIGMTNCTFSGNTGPSGHAVSILYGSNTTIVNSILYNNGNTTPLYIFPSSGSIMPSGFNNIIQGGTLGGTNINPLFVSASDFHLISTSPAINAGNNAYLGSVTTDLDGNARIVNSTVDLGAYEFDAALSNTSFTSFNEFTVYPNPTFGILNIDLDEEIEKIDVYSLLGRKVGTSTNTQMDISNLASGVYLLTIETKDGKVGTKRIIKQ
jgi:hypothetical protein